MSAPAGGPPDLSRMVVKVVDVVVPAGREDELVTGFRELLASSSPDGMFSTELLRGERRWRVQTNWRDREAVLAARDSGAPSAIALLDRLGLEHSHDVFTVAAYHQPR